MSIEIDPLIADLEKARAAMKPGDEPTIETWLALCSGNNIAALIAEVKRRGDEIERLREDAERWRWFDEFAQASVPKKGGGTQRVAEWLVIEALWEHGSRSAAIDAARKHPGTAEQGEA